MPLPEATYRAISQCEIKEMVLPRVGEPWSQINYFTPRIAL